MAWSRAIGLHLSQLALIERSSGGSFFFYWRILRSFRASETDNISVSDDRTNPTAELRHVKPGSHYVFFEVSFGKRNGIKNEKQRQNERKAT